LREKIVDKIFVGKKYKFDAMYINIHNIGDESLIHRDNGDITFIYYSNPNWKLHWDGGTAFYNQEISDTIGTVSYKPARLVMFDSKTPHKPLSISKYAVDIRTVLVFKCTEVK
jgi:Rps23 Pro-64 3,4-dihydroxylase Tpa1-like proline 4-hydroxylase